MTFGETAVQTLPYGNGGSFEAHRCIGTTAGVYATSNGGTTIEYADFDWVQYKGYPRF